MTGKPICNGPGCINERPDCTWFCCRCYQLLPDELRQRILELNPDRKDIDDVPYLEWGAAVEKCVVFLRELWEEKPW